MESELTSDEIFSSCRCFSEERYFFYEIIPRRVTSNTISVQRIGDELLIKGEIEGSLGQNKDQEFLRILHLPKNLSHENIRAVFKSGTLTVRFTKVQSRLPD